MSDDCLPSELCWHFAVDDAADDAGQAFTGTCVRADGLVYNVDLYGVQACPTDAQGFAWDIPGGLPDLVVDLSVNGEVVETSETVHDTLTAFEDGLRFSTELGPVDVVRLDIWDVDADGREHVGAVCPGVSGCNTAVGIHLLRGESPFVVRHGCEGRGGLAEATMYISH
mgnify:FL=1